MGISFKLAQPDSRLQWSQQNERVVQTVESISAGAACDPGLVRESNEDRCFFRTFTYIGELGPERALIAAVADGMGGHAAGEAASERATQVLASKFSGMSSHNLSRQSSPDWPTLMNEAFQQANREVYEEAARWTGRVGMGTTLTAAVVLSDVVYLGHVGDSRTYLVRNGGIMKLTQDHTWVAKQVREGRMSTRDAERSERRGQLTQAIGLTDTIQPDVDVVSVRPGDRIVLCTDGITEMLTDAEILSAVKTGIDPQRASARLVAAANKAGGHDNIAVVVIDCRPEPSRPALKAPRLRRKPSAWAVAALAVVIALLVVDAVYLAGRYAGDRGGSATVRTAPVGRDNSDFVPELGQSNSAVRPDMLDLGGRPVKVEGR